MILSHSGHRPAEPTSIAVAATHHTLTRLLLLCCTRVRNAIPGGRVLQQWEAANAAHTIKDWLVRKRTASELEAAVAEAAEAAEAAAAAAARALTPAEREEALRGHAAVMAYLQGELARKVAAGDFAGVARLGEQIAAQAAALASLDLAVAPSAPAP